MGADKADLMAKVAHEIGCGLDDMLDAAKARVHMYKGQALACRKARDSMSGLQELAGKELEEQGLGPEETALVKRWLGRAYNSCESLLMTAERDVLLAEGAVRGQQKSVEVVAKLHKAYADKAQSIRDYEAQPDDGGRPSGARPAGSDAASDIDNRRAKAKKAKAAKAKKAKAAKAAE